MLAVLVGATGSAAGDGFYVAESFGLARARGRLAGVVGNALHIRVGLGMRIGNFALEPWVTSALQTDRRGAFLRLIGGEPAPGRADIEAMGVDAKVIAPVTGRFSLFVRGGVATAEGNGALEGYRGRGFGFAGGAQVTAQVRALGFLWAPLFFLKRGPMATGALVLEAGNTAYFLHGPGGDQIDEGVAHVSIGFAMGSTF